MAGRAGVDIPAKVTDRIGKVADRAPKAVDGRAKCG